VRADYAVSFCMQAKVRFYCTRQFLEKCREMDAEIGQLAHQNKSDMRRNRHTYLN
jgi:hypothetical protein